MIQDLLSIQLCLGRHYSLAFLLLSFPLQCVPKLSMVIRTFLTFLILCFLRVTALIITYSWISH